MVETSCRTQCLIFAEIFYAQLGKCGGDGVDERLEDRLLVVSDDKDFLNLGDF